jgi:hypothetical protein
METEMDIDKIISDHTIWLKNNGTKGVFADLRGANLGGADLRGADLQYANLRGANLRGADLREADLCGANLREADLYMADLRGANLGVADLCKANLCDANLGWADIRLTKMPDTDKFLNSPYSICHIRHNTVRIGCEYHTVEEWLSFSDEQINEMHSTALEWWICNKEIIFYIVKSLSKTI